MIKEVFKQKNSNSFFAIISYILSFIITTLVYLTNGTNKVYTNLMYIPIALISSTMGKRIGILHALISGLLVGPLMPLNVDLNLSQEPSNWIIRSIIYMIISLIIGFFSDYNKKNQEYITDLLTYDIVTDFKNIESLKGEDMTSNPRTIIALSVKEYEEILSFFGYTFTNRATAEVSKKIKEILKNHKNVDLYRYGSMDFILVFNHENQNLNIDQIVIDLYKLNKSVIKVGKIPIYIEIAMGMTNVDENTSTIEGTRQALLSLRYSIDRALKLNLFNKSIDAHYRKTIGIASDFKAALENDNIKVAYQNIYYSRDEGVYGAEALARWIKDNNEQIYPEQFVPIIEKTELINELSKYMINKIIENLVKNNGDEIISINFSPKDFKEEVISHLIKKIEDNKIPYGQLQVEITEDIFINKNKTIYYLELLRKYGVLVAIDDFGIGYSSYQYINELPIDIIKIDKSIIRKVENSMFSKSLVRSMVDFAKINNLKIIAEGVETREIADICRELDIDLLQGYYYHRPTIREELHK